MKRLFGSLIGDFCGAPFESRPWRPGEMLLSRRCRWSDDTVLTVATGETLLSGECTAQDFARSYLHWGRRYPDCGFGAGFAAWLTAGDLSHRNSWANGSAMRVSPVGWAASNLNECLELAERSAEITHGHVEGLRGARALAGGVFLLLHGATDDELDHWLRVSVGYEPPLWDPSLAQTVWDCSCVTTVPLAFSAFRGATSFIDTLHRAYSLGGDADTIGAMAGALAETRFPVPTELLDALIAVLPRDLLDGARAFEAAFRSAPNNSNIIIAKRRRPS